MNKVWRIWAKALGQKDGRNDREADIIAGIRTVILVSTWLPILLSLPMQ